VIFFQVLLSQSICWKHLQVNEFSLIVFHVDGFVCSETGRRKSVFGDGVAFKVISPDSTLFSVGEIKTRAGSSLVEGAKI
jgi:hypothetical protein